jgi:hypothetical protein
MELPSSTSFSPLGTIHLSAPHVLHPEACNPAMDLVALLGVSGGEANSSKGKGKALTGNSTRVALWRMSGSKVWEADVEGRVCGLAWTGDGQSKSQPRKGDLSTNENQACIFPYWSSSLLPLPRPKERRSIISRSILARLSRLSQWISTHKRARQPVRRKGGGR